MFFSHILLAARIQNLDGCVYAYLYAFIKRKEGENVAFCSLEVVQLLLLNKLERRSCYKFSWAQF